MALPHPSQSRVFGGLLLAGEGLANGLRIRCLFRSKRRERCALLGAWCRYHHGGHLHREFALDGRKQARAPRGKFSGNAPPFGGQLAGVRTAQGGQCLSTRNSCAILAARAPCCIGNADAGT